MSLFVTETKWMHDMKTDYQRFKSQSLTSNETFVSLSKLAVVSNQNKKRSDWKGYYYKNIMFIVMTTVKLNQTMKRCKEKKKSTSDFF